MSLVTHGDNLHQLKWSKGAEFQAFFEGKCRVAHPLISHKKAHDYNKIVIRHNFHVHKFLSSEQFKKEHNNPID